VLAVLPRSALCIARLPDSCKSVRCWEPSLERRRGGKAAQNPDFLNCVEARRPAPPLRALHACRSACLATCLPHSQNGLGLRGALERRGCDFFTTDLKDGPDSGALHVCWLLSGAPLPPVRLRSRSLHMQTWTSCCRASTSSSPPPSTRCAPPGLPPAAFLQPALLVSTTIRGSSLSWCCQTCHTKQQQKMQKWPAEQAYMTRERLAAAKKLRLILVAGVGCAPSWQLSTQGLVGQCLQRQKHGLPYVFGMEQQDQQLFLKSMVHESNMHADGKLARADDTDFF